MNTGLGKIVPMTYKSCTAPLRSVVKIQRACGVVAWRRTRIRICKWCKISSIHRSTKHMQSHQIHTARTRAHKYEHIHTYIPSYLPTYLPLPYLPLYTHLPHTYAHVPNLLTDGQTDPSMCVSIYVYIQTDKQTETRTRAHTHTQFMIGSLPGAIEPSTSPNN